jgi:hypothetical protein
LNQSGNTLREVAAGLAAICYVFCQQDDCLPKSPDATTALGLFRVAALGVIPVRSFQDLGNPDMDALLTGAQAARWVKRPAQNVYQWVSRGLLLPATGDDVPQDGRNRYRLRDILAAHSKAVINDTGRDRGQHSSAA